VRRCTTIRTIRAIKTPSKFSLFLSCAFAFSFLLASPQSWARNTSAPQNNQPGALSLDAYAAQLQKYSTALDKIKANPAEISRLRNSLPSAWTIQASGANYQVSAKWFNSALADLQAHPKNAASLARDIQVHLAALRQSAMELENPSAGIPGAQARARLDTILHRREFGGIARESALQRLEARIERWFFGLIVGLLKRLHISAKMGNRLAWIFIGLVFLLIVFWVFRTLSSRTAAIEMPSADGELPEHSRMWVAEALAAADRGEYREAIHRAYWAAISRLEDRKLLARDRSRTPRESLRLLRPHSAEQTVLQDLTARFELIWYGYRLASSADWSGAKAQLEKFGCLKP
jgi:Domain of unknown function (DUF4129)